MKKKIVALAACGLLLQGCQAKEYSCELYAMDTVMELKAYGSDSQKAIENAKDMIAQLEEILSATDENSDVGRLNSEHTRVLMPQTMQLLNRSMEIYEKSGGAFDPSIYPLVELWGFAGASPAVPALADIEKNLEHCGLDKIKIDFERGSEVHLQEDMKLGFGAIAKGYASDMVVKEFKECGIKSAIISLGGNVYAMGEKNGGGKWRVGIRNPYENSEDYLCILNVADKAVVTSGGYERCFTDVDGKTWHHIIDPATGMSAESGIVSATIVCEDGTLADALSTTMYILGAERAIDYWRKDDESFDMILATEDGSLYVTEGIVNDITTSYKIKSVDKNQ